MPDVRKKALLAALQIHRSARTKAPLRIDISATEDKLAMRSENELFSLHTAIPSAGEMDARSVDGDRLIAAAKCGGERIAIAARERVLFVGDASVQSADASTLDFPRGDYKGAILAGDLRRCLVSAAAASRPNTFPLHEGKIKMSARNGQLNAYGSRQWALSHARCGWSGDDFSYVAPAAMASIVAAMDGVIDLSMAYSRMILQSNDVTLVSHHANDNFFPVEAFLEKAQQAQQAHRVKLHSLQQLARHCASIEKLSPRGKPKTAVISLLGKDICVWSEEAGVDASFRVSDICLAECYRTTMAIDPAALGIAQDIFGAGEQIIWRIWPLSDYIMASLMEEDCEKETDRKFFFSSKRSDVTV